MRLDPYAREFGPFTDELDEALADGTTRLYLDTSLLMWLIRIGREARREFIAWCKSRPPETVRAPVWAAHELHRHLIRGTITANVQAVLSETERKIVEFAALANERADDEMCQRRGYADRGSFVSTMEQTVARFKSLSNVIRMDDHLAEASDEVVAFVNEHILATDLAPIVASLNASGEFRFSHLMPPGYLDRKEENKFGDVVIWEEMIADLPKRSDETKKPSAILLSRDEKTDWVSSAPAMRQDAERPGKSNRALGFDVTRPHPLLVHEFSIRSGGSQLYVVHPGVFASVLDYGVRKHQRAGAVANLLAAAYRPEFLDRLAVTELVAEAESALRARGRGTRQRESERFVAPSVSEVMALGVANQLREYNEATPPDQNAIAQRWTEQLRGGDMPPLEFGRLAAELAVLDRPEWRAAVLATLEALVSQISQIQINLVVTGMLCTAYFDRYAEPLRQPRANLAELALTLEADLRLKPAFEALASAFTDKEVELPYVPGAGTMSVPYTVDLAPGNLPRLIRDIRVGEQSVLQDPIGTNQARLLSTMMGKTPADDPTGKDLRALISRSYFIPFDRLDTKFDKQRITWPPAAGLVMLDTGSPGGLSATADDGGEG